MGWAGPQYTPEVGWAARKSELNNSHKTQLHPRIPLNLSDTREWTDIVKSGHYPPQGRTFLTTFL